MNTLHRQPFSKSTDDLWEAMLLGTWRSRLMGAVIATKNASATSETELDNGLFAGHAYSVMQARLFDPSKPAKTCVAEVKVTYFKATDWQFDASLMKYQWWDPKGIAGKRFTGASWDLSRATRYNVA